MVKIEKLLLEIMIKIMVRNIQDILNTKVSVHYHIQDTTPFLEVSLYDYIFSWPVKYRAKLDAIRNSEYHSERQKTLKRSLPAMYIAGIFPGNTAKVTGDQEKLDKIVYSNLVGIDIDAADNANISLDALRAKLFVLPFVAGVYYSSSGNGLYCIVPVKESRKTTSYLKYLQKLLKQQYNTNIDTNALDISRARYLFATTQDDYTQWTKQGDVQVFELEYIEREYKEQVSPVRPRVSIYKQKFSPIGDLVNDDKFCLAAADIAINKLGFQSGSMKDWLALVGLLGTLGAEGERLALDLSRNSREYKNDKEVKVAFRNMSRKNLDRNYFTRFFKRCKDKLGPRWITIVKDFSSNSLFPVGN